MEDSSRKNDKEKDIDKILCSIKERKFDTEKIKKDLGIDITVQTYYNPESATIEFEGKTYVIEPESRNITFNDGQNSIVKFVYNHERLKEILKELEFKAFNSTINGEKELINYLDSENNETEILNIFIDVNIVNIYKDKHELEKLKDHFKQRYCKIKKYISNLSLNSSFYFPDNKNDEIDFKILQIFKNDFYKFFAKDCSILYVAGPKGTSKSLFLMNYFYEINQSSERPLLYINYRKMKDLSKEKKNNIFKKELIYLFFEENSLESFYKEKEYQK